MNLEWCREPNETLYEAINTDVPPATSPLSPDEKKRLEKAIGQRPDPKELVDRNILKGR